MLPKSDTKVVATAVLFQYLLPNYYYYYYHYYYYYYYYYYY